MSFSNWEIRAYLIIYVYHDKLYGEHWFLPRQRFTGKPYLLQS